jgi:hypothetical protein
MQHHTHKYSGGLILVIIALSLLHNFLAGVRDSLQWKHQLQKVNGGQNFPWVHSACTDTELPDIAEFIYFDHGHLAIRFLELRRHGESNHVEVTWFAFLEPKGANNPNMILVQTKESALTKDKALNELQKIFVKDLVKNIDWQPTAKATRGVAI